MASRADLKAQVESLQREVETLKEDIKRVSPESIRFRLEDVFKKPTIQLVKKKVKLSGEVKDTSELQKMEVSILGALKIVDYRMDLLTEEIQSLARITGPGSLNVLQQVSSE